MKPSETALQFHIAGSSSDSKRTANVRAGWAALLRTTSCVIEFHRPLCLKCDDGRQTSLRALLRCMTFVATTAHEFSKVGTRQADNFALCDARPLNNNNSIKVKVLTFERADCLARLGHGHYKAHEDLQRSIQNISKCLKQLNTSLQIIEASEEDETMKYAMDLADYAYEDAASALCVTCGFKCGGDFSPMIEHVKRIHMNRNPDEEADRLNEFVKSNAWRVCGMCATAFLDSEDLVEHRRKFHNATE